MGCHFLLQGGRRRKLNTENASGLERASPVVLVVKILPANAGDVRNIDSIPGLGRPPGEGHGNPV